MRTMLVVITAATLMGSSMASAFTANTNSTLLHHRSTQSAFIYAAYYHPHIQSYSSGTRRDITRYSIEHYYTHRPHVHY
jgi:hypothetical protein